MMSARTVRILISAIGLLALAGAAAGQTPLPTAIQLSFDRPVDAVAAPFAAALAEGYFAAQGVNVSTNIANGASEAIARVASGSSEMALTDINALVRYRDKADALPVKAVFVVQNKAPYAIIARRNRGIKALADMEGKSLGVADGDPAIWFWPAVARQNGVNLKAIRQERISAAVREPLLAAGQIDAVTGISYLSAVNLKDRGVQADDLTVFRFAEYGCEAYGLAIIVNPKFAAAKPEAVRSFLRAVTSGIQFALKEPARAIDDVMRQMDGGSRDLEIERLRTENRENILSEEVTRDGVGSIDPARFEKSIGQMAEDFKFRKRPAASDLFDDRFLPVADGRGVN